MSMIEDDLKPEYGAEADSGKAPETQLESLEGSTPVQRTAMVWPLAVKAWRWTEGDLRRTDRSAVRMGLRETDDTND